MLEEQVSCVSEGVRKALEEDYSESFLIESGTVISIDSGIAIIKGLKGVKNQELIEFPGDTMGMAFNLDSVYTGVILLGSFEDIEAGAAVTRTYQVADIPVSKDILGRSINPLGEVLDEGEEIVSKERLPIEREAPPILHRAPVTKPLQTGIKVIDSVVPIGRGQRELILGDRQTGKTTIAIDTIINQRNNDVICIYCSMGQRIESVAKTVDTLKKNNAMDYTVVMIAGAEDPPGLSYIAPYAAMSLGEYFMEMGRDVLVVFDDLTRHARSYRELSLLLERPPGREAYPGDIFYIHSRLLERATHLKDEYGGGSLTALPIIETQAENISAYIPTNLISITDGQIYLSPNLFQKGNLPAVKIGKSVSRVGGKTQLPAYREITSDLKLTYSQFEELETFSSFGTRLDESTRKTLERGKRIRAALNQPENIPLDVSEQIAVLLAVTRGVLDDIPLEKINEAESIIKDFIAEEDRFQDKVFNRDELEDEYKDDLLQRMEEKIKNEL
ncbi:MAG: alternate F1F0 ATPase, F1 subunit alpha [Halanaerobiales bacterium]